MNADVAETRLIEVIHAAFSGNGQMKNAAAITALDLAITKMGLAPAVRAYLVSNFGVERLQDVRDDDLSRAVQFVIELETKAQPVAHMPIPAGTQIEGEILWIRGTVTWA